MQKHTAISLCIFSLLVAVIVYSVAPSGFTQMTGDFKYYLHGADTLFNLQAQIQEKQYLAPGFSFVLLVVQTFFSISLLSIRALQTALYVALVLGTYILGRKIFKTKTVAVSGALLVALFPSTLLQLFSFHQDLLYCVLFLYGLLTTYTAFESEKILPVLAASVLWACAMLTDPTALYIPIVIFLWACAIRWRTKDSEGAPRKPIHTALTILILVALLLAPWMYRNYLVFSGAGFAIVQKRVEIAPLNTSGWQHIAVSVRELRIVVVAKEVLKLLFLPYQLYVFQAHGTVSYTHLAVQMLHGDFSNFSFSQIAILFVKVFLTLFQTIFVFLAGFTLWKRRNDPASWLIVLLLTYVISAVVIYGGPNNFKTISLVNGFFLCFMPVVMLYGMQYLTEHYTTLFSKPTQSESPSK